MGAKHRKTTKPKARASASPRVGTKPRTWKPVEWTEYGPVLVMKGRFKGRLALYDDDASRNIAIVYLSGAPAFSEGWEYVYRKWLKRATPAEERRYAAESYNDIAVARARRKQRENVKAEE